MSENSDECGYQSTYWEGQGQSTLQDIPITEPTTATSRSRTRTNSSTPTPKQDTPLEIGSEMEVELESPEEKPKISLGNAEKHGEGFKDAYVSYEISSTFPNGKAHKVRRRYQDFLWLLGKYSDEIESGVIVPPLPDKNRLDYMDRFSPEFIRKRQIGLERFLKRLIIHPKLSKSEALNSFLTQPILGISESNMTTISSTLPTNPSRVTAVIEQISDVVVNVLSGTRAIEGKYVVLKKIVDISKSHFDKISSLQNRLCNDFKSLSESSIASSSAMDRISSYFGRLELSFDSANLDSTIPSPPKSLRTIFGDYAQLIQEQSTNAITFSEETELSVYLLSSEFAQFCRSARQALKLRDNKQFEFQDLEDHLQGAQFELAQLTGNSEGPAKTDSTTTTTTGEKLKAKRTAMVNYLSERIDSFRGIDPISSRSERVKRLEQRITDLQDALKESQAASKTVDSNIEMELKLFLTILNNEFRNSFVDNFHETWKQYHDNELSIWRDFARDTLDYNADV